MKYGLLLVTSSIEFFWLSGMIETLPVNFKGVDYFVKEDDWVSSWD
jgi:hypothetical protein